jgi:RNA polymerase sigma factor (sigma-70 family)
MFTGGTRDERDADFAYLIRPHLDDAYTLAHWLTANNADAESVVEEAYLRAFRATDQFSSGDALVCVLKMVRRTAHRWLRENRPSTLGMGEDLEADDYGSGAPYKRDITTLATQDIRQLRAAIAALPILYREALVLHDLQGLEYCRIAAICEIPISTMVSRLVRARDRMDMLCSTRHDAIELNIQGLNEAP